MIREIVSRAWDRIRRRTPAQHHAALARRMGDLGALERAAESELRRLRARRGGTRAIRRAERRLARLRRRTDRARRLVAAARPLVMRPH